MSQINPRTNLDHRSVRRRPVLDLSARPQSVVVLRVETGEPAFDLVFYGIEPWRLTSIAEVHPDSDFYVGGALVRAALRRRGLDPDMFVSSPFLVRDEPKTYSALRD